MSARSAETSVEMKMLEGLRGLSLPLPCVGLMETADAGTAKEQDLSSVQVRTHDFAQTYEAMEMFTLSAEIRLNVEQAESADGGAFLEAHEKIALWLERLMMGDRCVELETAEAFVDGFRIVGGDKDFDTSGGVWFAVWNIALNGRIKGQEA